MSAMFQFAVGGIGVMPDPSDNAASHNVPNHESGLQISFQVSNFGDEDGVAKVGVELDDAFAVEWTSGSLTPGQDATGFVSLGRLNEGTHTVLTFVNPGSGQNDHATNTFEVA